MKLVYVKINKIGFSLSYLFLENNGNYNNGIWTEILIEFFVLIPIKSLWIPFFKYDYVSVISCDLIILWLYDILNLIYIIKSNKYAFGLFILTLNQNRL